MLKTVSCFLVAAIAVAATGCLYSDVRAPLAYASPTPGDFGGNLGKEVTGTACNRALLWLVAWGDGGFDAALRDARAKANAAYVADVRADTDYTNVLFGLYQKQCTTISGRVASAPAATPGPSSSSTSGAGAP